MYDNILNIYNIMKKNFVEYIQLVSKAFARSGIANPVSAGVGASNCYCLEKRFSYP